MRDIIADGLVQLGLSGSVPPDSAEKLAEYGRLLLEKNQVMNLTAITDPADAARLHMLDCAALLGCGDFSGKALIDVGTGAGFPGLVLKILVPSLDVTLLDAQQKRLDWLAEVSETLGLSGLTFLHARGEETAHDPALRERFDYAAARAVAELSTLCELCLPYVKVGGQFLAMKSAHSDEESTAARTAISALGGRYHGTYDYVIPGGPEHRVILVDKQAPSPSKYPRRWAKMQNSPL